MIPDVPEEVDIQLQRQDFIVDKVLYDAADETEVRIVRVLSHYYFVGR